MWKDVCSKEQLLFDYETPEDITRCIWQKKTRVSMVWIVYRALILALMIIILITVCAKPPPGYVCEKNMIYITHWTYVAEIFAFFFILLITVQRYRLEKKYPYLDPMEEMPKLYKVAWCTYTLATSTALGVIFIFWVFIFNPEENTSLYSLLMVYACNPIVILFDFFINALPYRLLHLYLPNIIGICYIIFTLTYQLSGGTGNKGEIPVYEILDWRNPTRTSITCIMALGSLTIMHIILSVLNMVKHYFKRISEKT